MQGITFESVVVKKLQSKASTAMEKCIACLAWGYRFLLRQAKADIIAAKNISLCASKQNN